MPAPLLGIPLWAWLTGGYIGSDLIKSLLGQSSERGLMSQQLALQAVQGKARRGGVERMTKEQQKSTADMLKQLMTMRTEDKQETREIRAMKSSERNQDREAMMMASLLQAMMRGPQSRLPEPPPATSILGLLKGTY